MMRPAGRLLAALTLAVLLGSGGRLGTARAGSTTSNAPSGTVLASDNFSSSATGLLPSSSTDAGVQESYLNGEYQMLIASPQVEVAYLALVQQAYSDVSISADARLVPAADSSGSEGGYFLACRSGRSSGGAFGYRFTYYPVSNLFNLARLDSGVVTSLTNEQAAPVNGAASASHHLQLSCAGTTISGTIDGQSVASVQDSSYQSGRVAVGVTIGKSRVRNASRDPNSTATFQGFPGTADVRFSNLVLAQPQLKADG